MPDFRYVGLEPVVTPSFGVAATAFGLGAGVTLAMSGLDTKQAVFAGALASIMSAFALKGAGTSVTPQAGSARMAIVPWGVLVETDEAPRILRWAAVRKIEVETSRAHRLLRRAAPSSRVAIETERERFVGEAVGVVPLERLIEHFDAYAAEQAMPLALDLHGDASDASGQVKARAPTLEATEPACEPLITTARDWLESAPAVADLGLAPGGYRRTCTLAPTPRALEVLRHVLRDRTPKPADPRAFAAVVAAEIHATELVPDLVALAQCPHPVVAGVARQAAHKLGAPRAKTGTLEELGSFLFESDRARLHAWLPEGRMDGRERTSHFGALVPREMSVR